MSIMVSLCITIFGTQFYFVFFSDPNRSLGEHNGLMFQISHFLVEGCNF